MTIFCYRKLLVQQRISHSSLSLHIMYLSRRFVSSSPFLTNLLVIRDKGQKRILTNNFKCKFPHNLHPLSSFPPSYPLPSSYRTKQVLRLFLFFFLLLTGFLCLLINFVNIFRGHIFAVTWPVSSISADFAGSFTIVWRWYAITNHWCVILAVLVLLLLGKVLDRVIGIDYFFINLF